MNDLPRLAENKLKRLAAHFKIVMVAGARGTGKTTLLRQAFPNVRMIALDPVEDRFGARGDPGLFLGNFPAPLILDEIQFVPEILPALRRKVDQSNSVGQYFLVSSHDPALLPAMAEHLAGRVGVLRLDSLTPQEMAGQGAHPGWLRAYLDEPDALPGRFRGTWNDLGPLPRFLWRGGMPGLLDAPDDRVPEFLGAIIQTYVERDLRQAEEIRDPTAFGRFLALAGALTGREVNASAFARAAGVTPSTARRWLDLLSRTCQWVELPPYQGKTAKRLAGRPKGHLGDTGIACRLQRLPDLEAVAVSPNLGALFETLAVNAVLRQFVALSAPPKVYHWRTCGGAAVDLLIEHDGRLYPICVRCRSTLARRDTRGLRAFRETYPSARIARGLILYAGADCVAVDEDALALPWNAVVAA